MFLKSKSKFVCYAPIDLKNADFFIRDGFDNTTNTPLSSAIEPIGESVIALSGMDTAVPDPSTTTGVSVKFGSDTQEYTVTSRTLGSGTDEVQDIEIDDDVSGGTFTLTFGGQETGTIAYNAVAATVQAALQALSTVGLGNVVITQASPVWRATFGGDLASSNVGVISGDGSSLTGGDTTTVAIAETTPGVDNTNEIQTITQAATVSGGNYTITFDGETTAAIAWDAAIADIELNLESLDNIPQGECTVGGGALPATPVTLTFSGTLAGVQPLATINSGALTGGGTYDITETTPGVDAVVEVNTIVINDSVSGGTFTLTQGGNTTAPIVYSATAAVIEAALEAAPVSLAVAVTGGPGPGTNWVVTYDVAGAQTAMTGTGTNLTGGVATTVSVQVITSGSSGTETTSIIVTPVLVVATTAAGSVTFGGRKLEIKIGEGNLTYTENKPREYVRDRGALDTVRNADEEPVDVNFDFVWESITAVGSSAIPTVEDALKQSGEASAWLSTSSDACEPYCINIEVFHDPGCGGENTELVELKEFRYETLEHNISDAQISCSGKSNKVEATVTRGS